MPAPMDVSSFRRDPHPSIDPLKMLGQFATTAHTLQMMDQQHQLFEGNKRVGQYVQSSMLPGGKGFDDAKLTVLMANDEVTRPVIAQALQDMHTRNIAQFTASHKKIESEAATMVHIASVMKGVIARHTIEKGPGGETIFKLERKHLVEGAGMLNAVSPDLKPQIVHFLGQVGNDPVEIYKRVEAMVQLTDTAANALQRTLGVYQQAGAGGVTEHGFIGPRGVTRQLPPIRHQPTVPELNAPKVTTNPVTGEETTLPAGATPMYQGGGGQAPGTGGLPAVPNVPGVPRAPISGPGAQPGASMPGGFSSNFGGFITGAEIGSVSPPQDMSRTGVGPAPSGGPMDIRPPAQRMAQTPGPTAAGATYAPPLPRARPEDLGAVVSPEVVPMRPSPAVLAPQAAEPVPMPTPQPRLTKISPMVEEELKSRGGPIAKKTIEDITAEGNSSADMKQVIQKVTETFDTIQEGNFQPGAGSTAKEFIARMASALGVPEATVDRITHLGRAQEYEKLSLQVAVLQLKKFMEGAGRFTNLEFDSFRKANPNWETDVRAVRRVLGFMDKMADIALQKQAGLDAWISGSRPPGYEKGGIDQFNAAWNKLLKDKGVLDTVYDDGRKLLQDLRVMRNRGTAPAR